MLFLKFLLMVLHSTRKLYGKMLYCLLFMGVRFSELRKLSVDCIKQNNEGVYYLELLQYKTEAFYEKPVYRNCIRIIQNEIEKNKKRFGADEVVLPSA